jgi:hypothetical protein
MRLRLVAGAVLAGSALVASAGASLAASADKPKPSLSISAITAKFDAKNLATNYTITVTETKRGIEGYISTDWKLALGLVDSAGASPPGRGDEHAAVDASCNNSRLPGGKNLEWGYLHELGRTFTWFHGDVGSYAGSAYGCDHTKMGPLGHQGVVSVTVSDYVWSCTASYNGTNDGTSPEPVCGVDVEKLAGLGDIVGRALADERMALQELGRNDKRFETLLGYARERLGTAASFLDLFPGSEAALGSVDKARSLDIRAIRDPNTKSGDAKALESIRQSIALKKKAMSQIDALVLASG